MLSLITPFPRQPGLWMCIPGSLCSRPSFCLLSLTDGCWKFSTCLCRFPPVSSTLFHIWMAELSWAPSMVLLALCFLWVHLIDRKLGAKEEWSGVSIRFSFSSGRLQLLLEFSYGGLPFLGCWKLFLPLPLRGLSDPLWPHNASLWTGPWAPFEYPAFHLFPAGLLLTHSIILSSVQFFLTYFHQGLWADICLPCHSSLAHIIALCVLFPQQQKHA